MTPFINTCLKILEVICFHLLTVIACIAWTGMRSCLKFLGILVRVVYFMHHHLISKTVHCNDIHT